MALLDVSEVFSDPLFITDFTVRRHVVTVNAQGRGEQVSTQDIPASGVVIGGFSANGPAGDGGLQRAGDGERSAGGLTIYTQFPLQTGENADGTTADEVIHQGVAYIVFSTNDFTHFGSGFVLAVCSQKPLNP